MSRPRCRRLAAGLALAAWAIACSSGDLVTDTDDPLSGLGHNASADCLGCHGGFKMGGAVFTDSQANQVAPDVPVTLTRPDGSSLVLDGSNSAGNIAQTLIPDGTYLIQVGDVTSRTWHSIPGQGACNVCHTPSAGAGSSSTKTLPSLHTQLPPDSDCTHCHHFPATMSLDELVPEGVLNTAASDPMPPESSVRILDRTFSFDPSTVTISTVRPDIFAPGFYSMFDVILAVASSNGIDIEYSFDESRQTHFIETIEGAGGDYWYHFSYDTGGRSSGEIGYRRAYRWDEALWRPGVLIQVVEGEALDEIKAEYLEEIQRETTNGHLIPSVRVAINPSTYQGNPPQSHRITVSRDLTDVVVTPHDLRATGYPTPYPKPFRPGVVTSMDILLSLMDQGELDLVTGVFYTRFAGNYIQSYYVVAMGFPGVGTAHSSGRQGFVYTTNNGTFQRLPNDADRKFHMTSDIAVLHAPDFSYWRWIELGNPHYEDNPQLAAALERSIAEDNDAVGRGFNLHRPVTDPRQERVAVSFNIFHPGEVRVGVLDGSGTEVAALFEGRAESHGIYRTSWPVASAAAGTYHVMMTYGGDTQLRAVRLGSPESER